MNQETWALRHRVDSEDASQTLHCIFDFTVLGAETDTRIARPGFLRATKPEVVLTSGHIYDTFAYMLPGGFHHGGSHDLLVTGARHEDFIKNMNLITYYLHELDRIDVRARVDEDVDGIAGFVG